jgi:hypothetical protein
VALPSFCSEELLSGAKENAQLIFFTLVVQGHHHSGSEGAEWSGEIRDFLF